jgi:hypothetical protein
MLHPLFFSEASHVKASLPAIGLGAIVLLVGLLISAVAIPAVYRADGSSDLDNDGTQDTDYQMSVALLDEDGNPVETRPLRLFSFMTDEGVEFTQVQATVSWQASGQNVDWDSFFIDMDLIIESLDYSGQQRTHILTAEYNDLGPLAVDDFKTFGPWSIADLVALANPDWIDHYTFVVTAVLDVEAMDLNGIQLTDSTSLGPETFGVSTAADSSITISGDPIAVSFAMFSAIKSDAVISPFIPLVLVLTGGAMVVLGLALIIRKR